MNLRTCAAALLLIACLPQCSERKTGLAGENERLWGRRKVAAEVQALAKTPIDAGALATDSAALRRVLSMQFDELVTRYGYLRLQSTATFELNRNGHRVPVVEKTVVEHGLDGTFRVVQKDEDDAVTREIIYNNGVVYFRNGGTGKMRVGGIAGRKHYALREEAWKPLQTFAAYYGPRLGVAKLGRRRVARRNAIRYRFTLRDGPEVVTPTGMKGAAMAPVSLRGELYVDTQTGVPTKGELRGQLRIPGAPNAKPGELEVSYTFTITPGKPVELKPEAFIPTIAHRPVDLDPLRFLKEDTRTSTIIGGGR